MFTVLWQLKDHFKKHKWNYLLYSLALIFSGFADIFFPRILGKFIDAIVDQTMTTQLLMNYSLQTLFVIFSTYIASYIWGYGLFSKGYQLQWNLRRGLMGHFLKMRAPYFEKYRSGDLIARGTQDISAIASSSSYGLMVLLDGTIYIIALIIVMIFTTDIWLTVATITPLLPIVYFFKRQGQLVGDRYEKAQEKFSEVNNEVLEMVDGIRVIRAYVKEDQFIKEFKDQTEELYLKNKGVAQANAFFGPVVKSFEAISMVIALGMGSYLIADGRMTVGEIISFQMYLSMMIWPLMSLAELVLVMQQGSASMRRYQEVRDTTDDIDRSEQRSFDQFGVLQFKNYSFSYPNETSLQLDHINLTIEPGSTLGIVGKIGSGKTTLVTQLINQYATGTGSLTMDGINYQHLDDNEVRGSISYVPQDNILFSRSVRENILFGKPDATDSEILDAVELASFTEDLSRLEDGLDTLVGERGASISGGQKQRISIARALIKDAEVLILDDSLSAVDTKTEQAIIRNIKENRKNKTNIIVSHRLSAVKNADQIIVMDEGKITERGTHDELMNEHGWYNEQFRRQELKGGEAENVDR